MIIIESDEIIARENILIEYILLTVIMKYNNEIWGAVFNAIIPMMIMMDLNNNIIYTLTMVRQLNKRQITSWYPQFIYNRLSAVISRLSIISSYTIRVKGMWTNSRKISTIPKLYSSIKSWAIDCDWKNPATDPKISCKNSKREL